MLAISCALALTTMTVWDELKVVLLDLESSGALVSYPDPSVDTHRQPPFEIRLQWWASEIAEDLHQRFGDDVKLVVGLGPYPEPQVRRQVNVPEDIPDMDPTLMSVDLVSPITVASSSTVRGELRVENMSAESIVILTNGGVTAQVIDPRTGVVVGGFVGWQTMPGVYFRAAAGENVVVPVLVGTASFVPELGEAVPPGEWAIQATLVIADDKAAGWQQLTARRHVRTPLLPITVTN